MPLYDYECPQCGKTGEAITRIGEDIICDCGSKAKRLVSKPAAVNNQDVPWIRSVREVVSKDSGKRHCEEFLHHPTRINYQNWMKGEGIRPLDNGEKAKKSDKKVRHNQITKEVYGKHRQRCAIEVR